MVIGIDSVLVVWLLFLFVASVSFDPCICQVSSAAKVTCTRSIIRTTEDEYYLLGAHLRPNITNTVYEYLSYLKKDKKRKLFI